MPGDAIGEDFWFVRTDTNDWRLYDNEEEATRAFYGQTRKPQVRRATLSKCVVLKHFEC